MGAKQKIIIVGAGVLGAAHAYELSRNQNVEITLLEASSGPAVNLGTGASSGCVRRCYSSVDLARLANYGYDFLDHLQNTHPESQFFFRVGCISLGPAENPYQKIYRDIFAKAKFEVYNFTRDELERRYAGLSFADNEMGILDERAGYADPYLVTNLMVKAASARGVKTRFNTRVRALHELTGKVTGVELESGEKLAADLVVLAAGYHSMRLLRESGLQLQLPPTSARPVFTIFVPLAGGTFTGPVFADFTYNIYCKPEQGGALVGSLAAEDEEEKSVNANGEFHVPQARLENLTERAGERLKDANLNPSRVRVVKGYYDVSDLDWVPIQTESEIKGLYLSFATSGHGFKLAPALASLLASEMHLAQPNPALAGVSAQLFSLGDKRFQAGGVLA